MIKPKIRIRALMAIIAIVALGIWGEQMRRRRDYCLKKSLEHRTKLLMMSLHFQHPLMSAAEEEKLRRTYPHAAWHLEVSDAYLRCANQPWQAVPPEPDEPFSFPPGVVPDRRNANTNTPSEHAPSPKPVGCVKTGHSYCRTPLADEGIAAGSGGG
jgi:hypothetical protein